MPLLKVPKSLLRTNLAHLQENLNKNYHFLNNALTMTNLIWKIESSSKVDF